MGEGRRGKRARREGESAKPFPLSPTPFPTLFPSRSPLRPILDWKVCSQADEGTKTQSHASLFCGPVGRPHYMCSWLIIIDMRRTKSMKVMNSLEAVKRRKETLLLTTSD